MFFFPELWAGSVPPPHFQIRSGATAQRKIFMVTYGLYSNESGGLGTYSDSLSVCSPAANGDGLELEVYLNVTLPLQ